MRVTPFLWLIFLAVPWAAFLLAVVCKTSAYRGWAKLNTWLNRLMAWSVFLCLIGVAFG